MSKEDAVASCLSLPGMQMHPFLLPELLQVSTQPPGETVWVQLQPGCSGGAVLSYTHQT